MSRQTKPAAANKAAAPARKPAAAKKTAVASARKPAKPAAAKKTAAAPARKRPAKPAPSADPVHNPTPPNTGHAGEQLPEPPQQRGPLLEKDDATLVALQEQHDRELKKGYRGNKVDPTPNRAYTVAGRLAGEPTPETDPKEPLNG